MRARPTGVESLALGQRRRQATVKSTSPSDGGDGREFGKRRIGFYATRLAIGFVLTLYSVAMWLGIRFALYSSDFQTKDESRPAAGSDGSVSISHTKDKIKAFSILGERNSGTRWLYDHLNECFNHTIPVRRELVRYKHWFQDPYNTTKITNNTLVLAIFRNVYEWVEAMRKTPHHASRHIGLDWKTFLTRPWTMERVGGDLLLENSTGRICQDGFYYNEVVSCLKRPLPDDYYWEKRGHSYSERQPFYEMRNDGSGKPYASIVEMRAAKIRNFLSTAEYDGVAGVWVLRYEDLMKLGTKMLLLSLEEVTGVRAACNPYKRQKGSRRRLEYDMVQWLMKHVDWEAEALIGYHM